MIIMDQVAYRAINTNNDPMPAQWRGQTHCHVLNARSHWGRGSAIDETCPDGTASGTGSLDGSGSVEGRWVSGEADVELVQLFIFL